VSIATIVGEVGDGRYTIEIDFGSSSRDQTVANIDAYIGRLNETLNEVLSKIAEYNEQVEEQIDRLNAARDSYIALASANPEADPTAFNFERRKLTLIYAERDPYVRRRKIIEAEIATMQRKRTEFANLVMVETRGAWCTTYTLGATGEVATVDIPGDSNLILIAPQARGWQPSDGFLFERALCDPNQAFFNAAILAGWQSDRPTYRKGVVTGVDYGANRLDVELDDASLTGQGLDINKRGTLNAVPVDYLSCGASAFEEGDRVVVQFVGRSWDEPVVIGFVDNPKPCSLWYAAFWQPGGPLMQFTTGDLEDAPQDWPADIVALAESCMRTDLLVRVRFDRGGWETLPHRNAINADGYTPKINQYWDAGSTAIQDGPAVEFVREPNFGGTNIEPDYAVGVGLSPGKPENAGVTYPSTAIMEVLIQDDVGRVLFNGAFSYDQDDNFFVSAIRVAGGIRGAPAAGNSDMTIDTEYRLFSETGD
jgi:hypothetical protein